MIIFLLILSGFAGGLFGGMGMGGGTLLIPILSIFLNVPQHVAQGINLIAFIPMSIVAIIIHARNGLIEKGIIKKFVPIACVCAILGSLLAGYVPSKILRIIFGIFLIALAIFQATTFTVSKINSKKEDNGKLTVD